MTPSGWEGRGRRARARPGEYSVRSGRRLCSPVDASLFEMVPRPALTPECLLLAAVSGVVWGKSIGWGRTCGSDGSSCRRVSWPSSFSVHLSSRRVRSGPRPKGPEGPRRRAARGPPGARYLPHSSESVPGPWKRNAGRRPAGEWRRTRGPSRGAHSRWDRRSTGATLPPAATQARRERPLSRSVAAPRRGAGIGPDWWFHLRPRRMRRSGAGAPSRGISR